MFLLRVLICTPILSFYISIKSKLHENLYINIRQDVEILGHYRDIFLLIICFPSVRIFGWVEKVPLCCTVSDTMQALPTNTK